MHAKRRWEASQASQEEMGIGESEGVGGSSNGTARKEEVIKDSCCVQTKRGTGRTRLRREAKDWSGSRLWYSGERE
jgi:hypothetical protein